MKLHQLTLSIIFLVVFLTSGATLVFADDQDLAAASQNPVADMISLPIKNIFNVDRGTEDGFAYTLEFQPVLPVHLGDFNLINRFIVPVR